MVHPGKMLSNDSQSATFIFRAALLHSHIISLDESNLILNLLDCCRI